MARPKTLDDPKRWGFHAELDVRDRVDRFAREHGITRSEALRRLVEDALNRREAEVTAG